MGGSIFTYRGLTNLGCLTVLVMVLLALLFVFLLWNILTGSCLLSQQRRLSNTYLFHKAAPFSARWIQLWGD